MKRFYLFAMVLIFALPGLSQTGTIKGRIFDKTNNEPLPFSNIYIEGTDIGSTSDYDGNFIIAAVKPGFYQLTASSLGYEKKMTEEFRVLPGKTTFVNIEMRKTATQLEEVEITASVFQKRDEAP